MESKDRAVDVTMEEVRGICTGLKVSTVEIVMIHPPRHRSVLAVHVCSMLIAALDTRHHICDDIEHTRGVHMLLFSGRCPTRACCEVLGAARDRPHETEYGLNGTTFLPSLLSLSRFEPSQIKDRVYRTRLALPGWTSKTRDKPKDLGTPRRT